MDQNRENNELLEAPERLVTALKRLPAETPFIPATLDEAILRSARRQLSPEPRKPAAWFGLLKWGLAAAAACALFLLVQHFHTATEFVRGDINHDGKVDILDAFALARKLNTPEAADIGHLDLNGDGKVDERDVKEAAAEAVNLQRGRHS